MNRILILAVLHRLALAAALLVPAAARAEPLRIYAAGSLTGAFNALLEAFGTPPGSGAQPIYGPSGLLRERLEQSENADLFASADMGQPRHLAQAGRGTPVVMFARNRMCALARIARQSGWFFVLPHSRMFPKADCRCHEESLPSRPLTRGLEGCQHALPLRRNGHLSARDWLRGQAPKPRSGAPAAQGSTA